MCGGREPIPQSQQLSLVANKSIKYYKWLSAQKTSTLIYPVVPECSQSWYWSCYLSFTRLPPQQAFLSTLVSHIDEPVMLRWCVLPQAQLNAIYKDMLGILYVQAICKTSKPLCWHSSHSLADLLSLPSTVEIHSYWQPTLILTTSQNITNANKRLTAMHAN